MGIRLQPLLLLVSVFIFSIGLIALYRWLVTAPEERFNVSFNVSFPLFENRADKVLTLVLAALIITSTVLLVYVIVVPKVGERFTEFFVLGVNGTADQYPQNLSVGENASVILGITNHEYRNITYIIEVWLVNQTTYYNASDDRNETVINHMWFVDEIKVKLNHTPMNLDTLEKPQWEYNFTFSFDRVGFFKLAFLLFTIPRENYNSDKDYMESANQIMNSSYRNLHLWVNIN